MIETLLGAFCQWISFKLEGMVKEEAEMVNWFELKATDALCKLANLPPIQPVVVGKTNHAMHTSQLLLQLLMAWLRYPNHTEKQH